MRTAIRIEGLGKSYRLGETHEHTLSDQILRLGRRLTGRAAPKTTGPEEFWALRDINLEISEGEAVGIIGGNGAGKSTLLKILSRITQPTTGRALVRGRLSSLLEVGTGFHPELTGRENVFLNGTILGMRKTEVARKFDEIVAFSGVEQFIDTPVKRYSSGMYVRLAFAVAAHLEPDVLIIDEVLAVGDAEFQKRCLGKMGEVAREGRTVLFVSHNMAAIQKLCARAILLRNGKVALVGPVHECIAGHLGGVCTDAAISDLARTDPRFWLKRIALKDVQGTRTANFSYDQKVVVEIEFEQSEAVSNLELTLRIATAIGTSVFSSERPVDKLGPLAVGHGKATVTIPAALLVPGTFLVTVGVHVPGMEVLALAEHAISFLIHETGSSLARYANLDIGCVVVDCSWRDGVADSQSSRSRLASAI
jgi:lipopolysaccharide transport system ATP-binding protein